MNWSDFFAMGGYAFYVWSAWGLTGVVLLWQFTQPRLRNAKLRRELKRHYERQKLADSKQ
ncbi:MAG: heme exporter protein CcmD [Gammaproteobacteria bacterium]|nr:heme exporter protein CcmD [Gammaproteobacteria bacterium]